jgi:hypothetical protein
VVLQEGPRTLPTVVNVSSAGLAKKRRRNIGSTRFAEAVLDDVERRWARKLEQQALAWKGSRTDIRGATATGVPVVRRSKQPRRSHDTAAKNSRPTLGGKKGVNFPSGV